jgi:hypothetical protein
MNKEECEKASEIISEYMFTSNEYTPSVDMALEALTLIDKLIAEHFEKPPLKEKAGLLDEYKCELNWEDKNECKYYLYYDKLTDYIYTDANCSCQTQGTFYFKSKKDVKEFIEKAGKDNIKRYMFDVWE